MVRKAIDFLVAGGRDLGLGHVVRSARLANEAGRRGWTVRGFVDGDRAAREAWERTSEHAALPWPHTLVDTAPTVALDLPWDKTRLLDELSLLHRRALLIDDERDYPAPGDAEPELRGWRLLPGLHHAPLEPTAARDQNGFDLLSGAGFSILSPTHRAFSPSESSSRRSLLVTLGGSDPHRAGPELALTAQRVVERRAQGEARTLGLDVVFGPSFEDPEGRDAARLRAAGCRVHRALTAPAMVERMRDACLAIVGFGTTLTELAWHATPFLTVAHHASDLVPARSLESRGLGRMLGAARALDLAASSGAIERALNDPIWRQESAARGRAALGDGRGAERILARIERDLRRAPGVRERDRADSAYTPRPRS